MNLNFFIYADNYEGHKAYKYGGHPAPSGPALPNLINAVSILKSKSTPPPPKIPKKFSTALRRSFGKVKVNVNCTLHAASRLEEAA